MISSSWLVLFSILFCWVFSTCPTLFRIFIASLRFFSSPLAFNCPILFHAAIFSVDFSSFYSVSSVAHFLLPSFSSMSIYWKLPSHSSPPVLYFLLRSNLLKYQKEQILVWTRFYIFDYFHSVSFFFDPKWFRLISAMARHLLTPIVFPLHFLSYSISNVTFSADTKQITHIQGINLQS